MSKATRTSVALIALVGALSIGAIVQAGGAFRQSAVGGVSIDAVGVVRTADPGVRAKSLAEIRKTFGKVPAGAAAPVEIRKISLKRLHEAVAAHIKSGGAGHLPDEVRYLAGLQRIEFVLVYPEQNDIVIAGPAEGWRLDDAGNVVGLTTGRPVLHLDDLLVALRSVHSARTEGITCSIDPTAEGYRKLNTLLESQRAQPGPRNLVALERAMKTAFGPQQITVTGVPSTSHYARVLVAADYRMKRLAMKLEPSPVKGLPSYLDLAKRQGASSNPRWWLACDYEPIARSEDGLAFEIRGSGVKAFTEDEFVDDGKAKGTGKTSPAAQQWADTFSEKYEELSTAEVIFGELRNIMDVSVVAALIEHHRLADKAGLSVPLFYEQQSDLAVQSWNAPKTVAPQCSFLKTRKGWMVTASGGVQVESWQVASKTEVAPMADVHQSATPAGKSWWWN